jgi:hypothetical protein
MARKSATDVNATIKTLENIEQQIQPINEVVDQPQFLVDFKVNMPSKHANGTIFRCKDTGELYRFTNNKWTPITNN